MNPRPLPCKGSDLPADLQALFAEGSLFRKNDIFRRAAFQILFFCVLMFFRHLTATDRSQEVIQPQIPLRLPCYDLTLLAKFRFESGTLSGPSPIPHSDGLTGGVCKEQGRIHRAMLRRDYYGFQLHEGGFQPSIRTSNGFMRLTSPFGVVTHCPAHCSPRVAQEIRGILTYR